MVLLRFRSKFLPYAAGTCHSILRKKMKEVHYVFHYRTPRTPLWCRSKRHQDKTLLRTAFRVFSIPDAALCIGLATTLHYAASAVWFYTNHSRVVLWVPVHQTFSLTEILNHIQTALREQCPKLIDEITANSCISGFTLELARSHLNNKN